MSNQDTRIDIDPATADPVDILARTIWGEARGEDRRGREAVASVVMNRLAISMDHQSRRGSTYWWGMSVAEICLKPWQFSCWLESDPNRAKMLAVGEEDRVFRECLATALAAVEGRLDDATGGADHYFSPRAARPKWADGREPVAVIGHHQFYRLVGGARA